MYEELLSRVPLFASLSRRELTQFADACRERDYAPADLLVRQGRSGMGLFILVVGNARVTCRGDDGVEHTLGRLEPGNVLGEMALLTAGHPTATVTAESPVRALVLPLWEFRAILREYPDIAIKLLALLGRRLSQADQQRSQFDN